MKNKDMEYQKAINYIIDLIKDGKLVVGSKIPSERDIAEIIGIGRSSIREAISILRGMGLIESRHGSGNYIAKDCNKAIKQMIEVMLALGSITYKDVLEFRRVISQAVCKVLLVENNIDEETISDILDKMHNADTKELATLDYLFHIKLINATKNSLFITIMEAIAGVYLSTIVMINQKMNDDDRKEFIEIHSKIYESIINKDEEKCMYYLKQHYDLTENKLM